MLTKKEWAETLDYYNDVIFDIAVTSGNPTVTEAKLLTFLNTELRKNWPKEVGKYGGLQWQIVDEN